MIIIESDKQRVRPSSSQRGVSEPFFFFLEEPLGVVPTLSPQEISSLLLFGELDEVAVSHASDLKHAERNVCLARLPSAVRFSSKAQRRINSGHFRMDAAWVALLRRYRHLAVSRMRRGKEVIVIG